MATILPQTVFEAWDDEGWSHTPPTSVFSLLVIPPFALDHPNATYQFSYSGIPRTSGFLKVDGNQLSGRYRQIAISTFSDRYGNYISRANLWIFQQNGSFRCIIDGATVATSGFGQEYAPRQREMTGTVSNNGVMVHELTKGHQHFRVTVTFGSVTFRTVGGGASVAYFIDGIQKAFFTVPKDSQVSRRWTGFRNLRIEISGFKGGGYAGAKVYRNGALVAASIGTSISLSTFSDKDVIEIRMLTVKEAYTPLFANINANTRLPLFADINKKTHLPLFAGLVGYTISYAFLNRSHLWTRISTHYSNTSSALSDDYFPGRSSNYDGSSGDSGKNIRVSLSKLYANSSAISNSDGTKSITLYFFCALCNWGCTSDYESGDVDFSVLWKTFTVANIPRATSDDPGPGNEPFAFSFTITIRKNGNRYLATAVSITDKDGNTY